MKLTDLQGLVRHEARSVDRDEVTHSNSFIVADRTTQNIVWVNDGAGTMVPASSVDEWYDVIEDRLVTVRNTRTLKDGRVVPVAMRKDAAVVIDCVFMLDPDYTGKCEDMTDAQRADATEKLTVMVDTMIRKVGARNVVGWTIHWDETHPHVQMMITPIDDQNRLRWKSFVAGPVALGRFHDEFREDLRTSGYDATDERVDGGKRSLGLKEYKENEDIRRQKEALFRQQRAELKAMARDVKPKWAALDSREALLNARTLNLDRRSALVDQQISKLPSLRRLSREKGRAEGLAEAEAVAEEVREDARRHASQEQEVAEAARRAATEAFRLSEAILAEVENYRDRVDQKFREYIDRNNALARRKTAKLQAQLDRIKTPEEEGLELD